MYVFDPGKRRRCKLGGEARWEGKITKIEYRIRTGARPVGMTQSARNYEDAIKKIWGRTLLRRSSHGYPGICSRM